MMAEKFGDEFPKYAESILKALEVANSFQKKKEEQEPRFRNVKDHITIVIGKIIRSQSQCLPDLGAAVSNWIKGLPIKFERKEGRAQHEFLVDVVQLKPELAFGGEELRNLNDIIRIFVEIIDTKFSTDKMKIEILRIFSKLASDEKFQKPFTQAIAALEKTQQIKLKNFFDQKLQQ
jgi:hypothetical protein